MILRHVMKAAKGLGNVFVKCCMTFRRANSASTMSKKWRPLICINVRRQLHTENMHLYLFAEIPINVLRPNSMKLRELALKREMWY